MTTQEHAKHEGSLTQPEAQPVAAAQKPPVVAMIWAQTPDGVIGRDGDMPWYVPEDFRYFKNTTMGSPVIMGRTTWDSLPASQRPLPGRTNIVLTRSEAFSAPGAVVARDIAQALDYAQSSANDTGASTIWVMGGGSIYSQFMPYAQILEVTHIDLDVRGDTSAPVIPGNFTLFKRVPETGWLTSTSGTRYAFHTYTAEGAAV